jgi:DNA-binding MarR family transcriptional regulator
MNLMMALGRRVRQRQPGDTVDFSAIPILKVLSHRGPLRLSTLAHTLDLDASTVSRHARQLEERGLLERTDDPDDGRASRVAISERGQACLVAVFETRRQIITTPSTG